MIDLYSFLSQESASEFSARLSDKGGYITFSNSGRRGKVKYFTMGLESFISVFKDISKNLEKFQNVTIYDEKKWRDLGSQYFTDPVANAMITVQTKPVFSTLSKIIKWANNPDLVMIETDLQIDLSQNSVQKTIDALIKLSR